MCISNPWFWDHTLRICRKSSLHRREKTAPAKCFGQYFGIHSQLVFFPKCCGTWSYSLLELLLHFPLPAQTFCFSFLSEAVESLCCFWSSQSTVENSSFLLTWAPKCKFLFHLNLPKALSLMKWLGECGVYFRNECSEEAGVIENRNQKYKLKCGYFLLTWTVFEMGLLLVAQPLTWGCWWSLFQFYLGVAWVPLDVTGTGEWAWLDAAVEKLWDLERLGVHSLNWPSWPFCSFFGVFQVRKWWETAAVTSLSASMSVWRSCHI